MLIAILRRAVELLKSNDLSFYLKDSPLAKLLTARLMSTKEFLSLDDHDIMFHIKQWINEKDIVLRDLCNRFINRRLFRSIDINWAEIEETEVFTKACEIITQASFPPNYYLFRDSAADIPYFGPYNSAEPKGQIYIEAKRHVPLVMVLSLNKQKYVLT